MACSLRRSTAVRLPPAYPRLPTASGDATGNRVRASLSALFSWAMRQGLCDVNPVAGSQPRSRKCRATRVLSDHELKVIWSALGADDYSAIIKLLILVGCRREEIGSLAWSEVSRRSDRTAAAANQEQPRAPHSDHTGGARHSRQPRSVMACSCLAGTPQSHFLAGVPAKADSIDASKRRVISLRLGGYTICDEHFAPVSARSAFRRTLPSWRSITRKKASKACMTGTHTKAKSKPR